MSIRKSGQVIAGTPNITTGHHVGEIFWTSRLDNELNGAVDADGATYSVEAFTGERSVPALLADGKLPYVSMAEYESIVSANGSCRAWGWDNGDTFRVPTLKDVYLMAGQAESAGEFISESLPNISGKGSLGYRPHTGGTMEGAFYYDGVDTGLTAGGGTEYTTLGFGFNASRSSSTYQDGAKVRPDSVRYRAMVQLSTGVKEDATQLKEYKFNNPHFLGESKWTDVDPMNASWLISNGNFHKGATYTDMYKQLQVELNASLNVGDTVEIDGRTFVKRGLPVKLSTDTYDDYDFVVNTADETFRLPLKTKLASGSAVVGNGMSLGLTNGIQNGAMAMTSDYRMFKGYTDMYGKPVYSTPAGSSANEMPTQKTVGVTTDPTKSGIETSSNGLKLYFYVGDVLQDPALINAGAVLDYFSKLETVHCVVETFKSGSSWYRVYDDGWVEQGGQIIGSQNTITFLKSFKDTNYNFQASVSDVSPTDYAMTTASWNNKTQYGVTVYMGYNGTVQATSPCDWQACGYGA